MVSSRHIGAAFKAECPEAKEPECWYVCLESSYQRYGGPEEGGWFQTMTTIVKYQSFMTEDLAKAAKARIEKLAAELTDEARRNHGAHCGRQMEWLEARGLDADYFPEDDGPEEYSVNVYSDLPEYDNQHMTYE